MLSSAASRTQRAEAKYNVTTDFPQLNLHAAAADGDYGSVKFALEHGQPVNSVLDGVLPLHAASSGGNEMVVQLLIDCGADVNAARLPRKYSASSSSSSSYPVIGSSGATPLHFAAANGHLTVIRTLLLHGAHPGRKDKHGITPITVARERGYDDCAQILAEWEDGERDRDLKARERLLNFDLADEEFGVSSAPSSSRARTNSYTNSMGKGRSTERHKLRVKRSIDTALQSIQSLKSTSSSQGPSSPITQPDQLEGADWERRGSLSHAQRHPLPSGKSKRSQSKRPQSAGTGAEQPTQRKLNSKYSLLSLFRRDETTSPISSPTSATLRLPGSPRSPRDELASSLPEDLEVASGIPPKTSALLNSEEGASTISLPGNLRPLPRHRASSSNSASPNVAVGNKGRRLNGEPLLLNNRYASDDEEEEDFGTIISTNPLSPIIRRNSLLSSPPLTPISVLTPLQSDTPTSEIAAPTSEESLAEERARGNSVSSIEPPPQMSWGSTNTSDASGVNTPPRPETVTLPSSTKNISSSASPDSLLLAPVVSKGSKARARTSSGHSSSRPSDIDIRTISSHAQAERRVLEAQQLLLHNSPVEPASSESIGQFAASRISEPSSVAWSPLSAKLGAYGESLRQLRRVEESSSALDDDETEPTESATQRSIRHAEVFREIQRRRIPSTSSISTPPQTTLQLSREKASSASSIYSTGRARNSSASRSEFLSTKTARANSSSQDRPRRPSTSSGLTSSSYGLSGSSLFDQARKHQTSQSVSSMSGRERGDSVFPEIRVSHSAVSPPSPSPISILNRPSSAPGETNPISAENDDEVPPTPELPTKPSAAMRQLTSANKLTRMGFSGSNAAAALNSTPNASYGPPSSRSSSRSRFGLGNIIHTLTGKPSA